MSRTIEQWLILNDASTTDTATHACYRDHGALYHADTCRPLRAADDAGHVRLEALARRPYPGKPLSLRAISELRTVGFWDVVRPQNWGLDWHRNEGVELTYVTRGHLAFQADDQSYLLRRGDLTVTRPWQRHRVGDPYVTPSLLHWLILDVGVRRSNQAWRWPSWLVLSRADLDRLSTLLRHNDRPVWRAGSALATSFTALGEIVIEVSPRHLESRLKLHINELLFHLLNCLNQQAPAELQSPLTAQRAVERFLDELTHEYASEWTVDAMADRCGLGRSRFLHYCRLLTNLTPIEHLTRLRVVAAARLLVEKPDLSITQVALRCGFGSGQYLATVFRRYVGVTPRQHRSSPRKIDAVCTGLRRPFSSATAGRHN